ncbi:MAG: hypothetical protein WDW36_002772 [Sanguina aurantia]
MQVQIAQSLLMSFATQQLMPMQATLLHSALPFMLNLPPTRVADKLRELLGEAQARPVLDKLMKSTGSSEMIAQRVCLEYLNKHGKGKLETAKVLQFYHANKGTMDFTRPLTVQDLLKHLDVESCMAAVHARVPGIPHQTVELAATLCMADVEAAVQLLSTSALSTSATSAPSLASLLSGATHVSTMTGGNGSSISGGGGGDQQQRQQQRQQQEGRQVLQEEPQQQRRQRVCAHGVSITADGTSKASLAASVTATTPSPISVRRSTASNGTQPSSGGGHGGSKASPHMLSAGPTTTTLEILLTLSDDPDATFSPQDMAAAISAAVALNVAQTSGSSSCVTKSFPSAATATAAASSAAPSLPPRSTLVSFPSPAPPPPPASQPTPCQALPTTAQLQQQLQQLQLQQQQLQQQLQQPLAVAGAPAARESTPSTSAAPMRHPAEDPNDALVAAVVAAVDPVLAEAAAGGYCYSQVDIACELKQFTDRLLALQNGEGAGDAAGLSLTLSIGSRLGEGADAQEAPADTTLHSAAAATAAVTGSSKDGTDALSIMLPPAQIDMLSNLVLQSNAAINRYLVERQGLHTEITTLNKHKEWADSRISDLIRKACESDKPHVEELKALREEKRAGKADGDEMKARYAALEASFSALKENTYRESSMRREVEFKLQSLSAEMGGRAAAGAGAVAAAGRHERAALGGSDVPARGKETGRSARAASMDIKSLMKRSAAADCQKRKAADERSEAVAAVAEKGKEVERLGSMLREAERLSRERLEGWDAEQQGRREEARHHQKTLQSLKAAKQSAEAQLASGNEGKQALQARVESLTADNSQLSARLLAAETALAQQLQQADLDAVATANAVAEHALSFDDCVRSAGSGGGGGGGAAGTHHLSPSRVGSLPALRSIHLDSPTHAQLGSGPNGSSTLHVSPLSARQDSLGSSSTPGGQQAAFLGVESTAAELQLLSQHSASGSASPRGAISTTAAAPTSAPSFMSGDWNASSFLRMTSGNLLGSGAAGKAGLGILGGGSSLLAASPLSLNLQNHQQQQHDQQQQAQLSPSLQPSQQQQPSWSQPAVTAAAAAAPPPQPQPQVSKFQFLFPQAGDGGSSVRDIPTFYPSRASHPLQSSASPAAATLQATTTAAPAGSSGAGAKQPLGGRPNLNSSGGGGGASESPHRSGGSTVGAPATPPWYAHSPQAQTQARPAVGLCSNQGSGVGDSGSGSFWGAPAQLSLGQQQSQYLQAGSGPRYNSFQLGDGEIGGAGFMTSGFSDASTMLADPDHRSYEQLLPVQLLQQEAPAAAAVKAAPAATPKGSKPVKKVAASSSSSPEDIRAVRLAKVEDLRKAGIEPYAYRFDRTHFTTELKDLHSGLVDGAEAEGASAAVAGRVIAKRVLGKLAFLSIRDDRGQIQLYVDKVRLDEAQPGGFDLLKSSIDVGDIVGSSGGIKRTEKGELSVVSTSLQVLSKALLPLPDKWHGLADIEKRYRQRYVDMIVTEQTRTTFRARSKIVSQIRRLLEDQDFLEVETPVLSPIAGGADARPFTTFHNALQRSFNLRIATELHLKRMVVGGFERVFELGRIFRNEGTSTRHNPEFTSVELYQAYADYNDMMALAENILRTCATAVNGTLLVEYQGTVLDFEKPFRRATMNELVQEQTGVDFLAFGSDLAGAKAAAVAALPGRGYSVVRKATVKVGRAPSVGHVLNEMFEATVEKTLVQPTFVCEHPTEISPLAKPHRSKPGVTERFELFVAARELANSFSELTDPIEQRRRFEEQASTHAAAIAAAAAARSEALGHAFAAMREDGASTGGGSGDADTSIMDAARLRAAAAASGGMVVPTKASSSSGTGKVREPGSASGSESDVEDDAAYEVEVDYDFITALDASIRDVIPFPHMKK